MEASAPTTRPRATSTHDVASSSTRSTATSGTSHACSSSVKGTLRLYRGGVTPAPRMSRSSRVDGMIGGMRTPLCDRLGIEFPIFAFSHCRDVIAAVSKAGGFGVLGAAGFSPAQLEVELDWIDEHVGDKPYGVDIIVPAKYTGVEQGGMTRKELRRADPRRAPRLRRRPDAQVRRRGAARRGRRANGVDIAGRDDDVMGMSHESGRRLLDMVWAHPKVQLVANALGPAPDFLVTEAHERGVLVAGLVGTVVHAERQQAAGVDMIIAQGSEAGGHTGEIGTMVLVPQVVDAVAPTARARRRRHRRRPPDRRRPRPRRPGRVVRLGVADHRGGRDPPGGQGEVPRRHVVGHAALARPDRQAGPPAALGVDRRVGRPGQPRSARHAAAAGARRRGRAPDRPHGGVQRRRPGSSSTTSSARRSG